MPIVGSVTDRLERLRSAFQRDGFDVDGFPLPGCHVEKDGRIGLFLTHRTAKNTMTKEPKKAFYIEGDSHGMGYFLGLLAEKDIARMAIQYIDHVVLSFFNVDSAAEGGVLDRIQAILVNIICGLSLEMRPSIPREYIEELEGVLEGCQAANAATRVSWERLWALNFGIDCALAHIYSGKLFAEERDVHPKHLRTPIGCNGYALSGGAAAGKSFFGRDFMFPTADVFQDTACLIIYNPDPGPNGPRRPFVSQTAPGIIGSMTAMNADGLGIGVNMLPSGLCSPEKPGFNSLALNRDCAQYCSTAGEAVDRIAAAERGVSWLYPIADAQGKAYAVEAGRKLEHGEPFPYFDNVPLHYRRRLPTLRYIKRMRRKYGTPAPDRGLVARSTDYRYPDHFIRDWNAGLWRAWDRSLLRKALDFIFDLFSGGKGSLGKRFREEIEELAKGADFSRADFSERGFINRRWTEKNCPGPFYFAPQRERRGDLLVATNHCISPEMRLTEMTEWIALMSGGQQNDIQWRYDELNREILEAIDAAPSGIGADTAWNLINFLKPNGTFPDYYNPSGALPWEEVQVHGSVTLCELTGRTLTSLFGYYGDEPLTIHLPHYLG
jgi:hypothetical protein